MTIKDLKAKIAEAEANGLIDDNTQVCTYADEFGSFLEIGPNENIVVDLEKEIEDKESYRMYCQETYCNNKDVLDKRISEIDKEIAKLKSFGKHVVVVPCPIVGY